MSRAGVPTMKADSANGTTPPTTPDGRYMVVRGRLWRVANPHLPPEEKEAQVKALMTARREVKAALAANDAERLAAARNAVNEAKIALGERGPVWWTDGEKDYNRFLVKNTPYQDWYASLNASKQAEANSMRVKN